MEFQELSHKDFAHRLHDWAAANKNLLLLILIAGIGFFGLLAAITVWRQGKEEKAALAYAKAKGEIGRLQAVVQTHPSTAASRLALLDLSEAARTAGDWDECVQRSEQLYSAARLPFFRVMALHGKGICLRGKGDWEEAAQTFERAAKEPGHVDPDASLAEAAWSFQWAKDPKGEALTQTLLNKPEINPSLRDQVEENWLWFQLREKF